MMSGITDINLVVVGNPDVASIVIRGLDDPDSHDPEEAFRYAFVMRCYANQGWKQLRLYERGTLGAADWEKLARELSQAYSTPGGKRFRAGNRVFEDLYAELDKYRGDDISDFDLSHSR